MSACVSASEPDYCNLVLANPDISGIGVRVAVYVQVGLNVLASTLFESNLQLTRDAARTSYVLSFSLVLASIIQWKLDGMGLFDALVSTQLATLMTVFMLFNIRYISSLGLSINISSALFLAFYTYWGIQTWTFPPCPSNHLTRFVLFGKSIPATNPHLRTFALVVFGFVGVLSVCALGWVVGWVYRVWVHGGEVRARSAVVWDRSRRERYGIGAYRLRSLTPLPILIYLVITTEQLVAANKQQPESDLSNLDQWTYGQTLGVVMLLAQLVELGLWVVRERKVRRELEWRGKSRSRRGDVDVGLPVSVFR
ncbi:hypothetical protein RSOLAG22IIIB_08203 [Rhizoctonia solani]|uniref:Uncharacterized protein n=1 Tax=Rhizoctonia solani TaxID=456999 RepID=A0A0K6FRS2_9AGAM|nr:hypothetical protein RSOLAG22IIIB_08203 [Rhizoctonia solani]